MRLDKYISLSLFSLYRKILGFRLTYREYMKSMPDGYQGKEVKCPHLHI